MDKNEEIFYDLLKSLQGELKRILVTWKRGEPRQGMWDDYQRIAVQIDAFLGSETSIDKARYEKEITSFRSKHYSLVKFIKGKVKEKSRKGYYFEDVCQSIDCLVRKLQNKDAGS